MKFNERQQFRTVKADHRIKLSKRQKFADGGSVEVPTVIGYPIIWGAVSSDRGGYQVRLMPNSALFSDKVYALIHHDFAQVFAGTVNDTMRINKPDDYGVSVEMDLDPNDPDAVKAAAKIQSGLMTGLSFSMSQGFEKYTESEGPNGAKYVNVDQFTVDEVTLTAIPAFDTSIEMKPDPEEDDDDAPEGTPPVAGGMSQETPKRTAAKMRLAQHRLNNLKL